MMRSIWLAEEKRRIEQLAREASSAAVWLEHELEDYEDSPPSTTAQNNGMPLSIQAF
jgi:hypothetical protein